MDEQLEATKRALQLNLDSPGELRRTGWNRLKQPKIIAGGAVSALVLMGLGISLFSSAPQSEVYEPQQETTLDKDAIVAGAQDSHANTVFQSTEQLSQFEAQLLSQEAQRYLLEAQRQTTEADKHCFGQSVYCALDQFQADAIAQIEAARGARDHQAMLLAIARVEAVEMARGATPPTEPEVNLSQLAIDNLIESHQRYRGASAEAKAWEVQQSD